MKRQTAKSVSVRCTYRTSGGRQCRLPASDAHSGLCPQHRAAQKQAQDADHFQHLTTEFQYFQTAQGINYSLMNLYQLLAQNRISPRRAAVLSHISSLLLQTLPQIDADRAAGIIGHTRLPAKTLHASVPDEVADSNEDSDLDSDSDSDSDLVPVSVNTSDLSIPEPDPRKKPS